METSKKYVLFYCDDCSLLDPAIAVFNDVHTGIELHTSSDPDKLLEKIKTRMPELLLIYLNDPKKDYINLVKEIRNNTASTSIPVLIYKELPGEDEMRKVFQKIKTIPD